MGFLVKQECPQCGGPVELDETDHILQCPYCDVRSFLFSKGAFRFVLPHKTRNKEILYVPYLRFRGVVYACQARRVSYRIMTVILNQKIELNRQGFIKLIRRLK